MRLLIARYPNHSPSNEPSLVPVLLCVQAQNALLTEDGDVRYGYLGLHRVETPNTADVDPVSTNAVPVIAPWPASDVGSVAVMLYRMSTGDEKLDYLCSSPDEVSTKIRDPLKRELFSRLLAITQLSAGELLQIISELSPFDVRKFSKSARGLVEAEERAKVAGMEDAKLRAAAPCVMVCHPGDGIDCEVALVQLRALRDLGHIEPLGVVANLWPASERARLLRGTLDVLGMQNVPVGIGSNGGSSDRTEKAWEGAQSYITPSGSERDGSIITAHQLLQMVFEKAAPASITLLCTSSLKDAAIFLRDYGKPYNQRSRILLASVRSDDTFSLLVAPPFGRTEELFLSKVGSVVLVGAVDTPSSNDRSSEQRADRQSHPDRNHRPLIPKDSSSYKSDMAAESFFFERCQLLGVPLIVVNNEVRSQLAVRHAARHQGLTRNRVGDAKQAAKIVALPSSVYDEFAETADSALGLRLREVRFNVVRPSDIRHRMIYVLCYKGEAS